MKKPLEIPAFANEDEEREFWAQINLADYYEPEDKRSFSQISNLLRARFRFAFLSMCWIG